MSLRISAESIILMAICTADMVITAIAVSAGLATEMNPLMAVLLKHNVWTFVAVKTISFIPFIILTEWYRRRNPDFARTASRCAIVLYLAAYTLLTMRANFPA
jgi:hypothetical protein